MAQLISVLRMVAQRAAGHWRLLIAMVTGAMLCASLMAAVILYSDAVRDLGLKHALATAPAFSLDPQVVSTSQKLNERDYTALRQRSDGIVQAQTAPFVDEYVHYVRTATFFPTSPGEPVSDDEDRPRANLQSVDRLEEHVHLTAGAFPKVAPAGDPDTTPTVEALIGTETAEKLGIHVGDQFDLHPHWRTNPPPPVRIVVTGLVAPNDITERYWFGQTDRFLVTTTRWETLLFFVPEDSLVKAVAAYLPDMDGTLETYALVNVSNIDSANARDVEARIAALRGSIQSQLAISYVKTDLDTTISGYREKLFFTRLPLFALIIQITGIVLFYLVMVSTMVVERQAGEIALLKSRGAGTVQVLMVFLIEGAGIALAATIAGPFIATGVISVLGLTPPFEDLSGGDLVSVPITPLAFGMSLAGGLLALAALVWPAYRACRYSITNYKQQISRPPQQSLFFRYYLDLALVVVAAFAFYQLRQRGSFVTDGLFGDLSADPILLATPSLFMLMVALIFLRLFPVLLRGVLWASRALSGPTVSLALTRMARSPMQHSRLILLLILATAVGMFAAGFRTTLERGYEDRAAYRAGAEVRLGDIRQPIGSPAPALVNAVTAATGSHDVCPVYRDSGYFQLARFRSQNVDFLGVDRSCFADLAYWRGDFGADSMQSLLSRLDEPAPTPGSAPIEIPADTHFIGLWTQLTIPVNQVPIGIRLRDGDGSPWEFRLLPEGPPQSQAGGGWQFVVADLTKPTSTRPAGVSPSAAERNWVFDGFFVQMPGIQPLVGAQITMPLDDLQATSATTLPQGWGKAGFTDSVTMLDTFESVEGYELVKAVSATGDPGALSRAPAPEGREGSVARLSFLRGRGGSPVVAFRPVRDSRPLPIVVNQRFLDDRDHKVGDEFPAFVNGQYITVHIAGAFDLFPGYDPDTSEDLFVADGARFLAVATRMPGAGSNVYPNEVWMGDRGTLPLDKEAMRDKGLSVEQIFVRQDILAEQSSDPLIAASWEGILFISFGAVLLVSALGFITYSGIGAVGRSLEFAILRTMGLSGRQIFGVVTFEQAFVVLAGVAAGTLLGFPLSRLMISYMGLTERGKDPLPPLISVVSWQSVITVYLLLTLVVASTVVALVALYSRLAVSRALRMGEL